MSKELLKTTIAKIDAILAQDPNVMEIDGRQFSLQLPLNETDRRIIKKVTAFVTREGADGRELLIFRHPCNGLQLPAGTVEIGEEPETAVLREAAEETGLMGLVLKRPLGMLTRTLPDDHFLVLGTTRLLAAPDPAAPPASDFIFYRGSYVRRLRRQNGFAEVLLEEWNERTEPPTLLRQEQGWLPCDWLTPHIHRYQYWLACTVETAESWTVFVDGHHFKLFWAPLRPAPSLVWPQDEWLAAAYDVLTTTALSVDGMG